MVDGLVSVVMPAYNSERTIVRAIESVFQQTYKDIELIVVDDCSSDNTVHLVEEYQLEGRLKLFCNDINKGVAATRNVAIREASGEYIAFLDSDDQWESEKLALQIRAMKENSLYVSHTSYERVDLRTGRKLGVVKCKPFVDFQMMLSGNKIGNLSGVYSCKQLGKFYQKSIGHEDYLMWLEILEKTPSVGLEQVLSKYSVSGSSLSGNKFKAANWHYGILRNHLGLSVVRGCYLTLRYMVEGILKRF